MPSTDWALKQKLSANYFIDISKHLTKKIELLKFYKDELNYPHSRSIKSVKSLASYRGVSCGVKYAEGFTLIDILINNEKLLIEFSMKISGVHC